MITRLWYKATVLKFDELYFAFLLNYAFRKVPTNPIGPEIIICNIFKIWYLTLFFYNIYRRVKPPDRLYMSNASPIPLFSPSVFRSRIRDGGGGILQIVVSTFAHMHMSPKFLLVRYWVGVTKDFFDHFVFWFSS